MQIHHQPQPKDYAQAVATLVAAMPIERAAQVYDFVRFLQNQPSYPLLDTAEDDDWLNDNEEQLAAEDALWDAARVRHQDKLSTLTKAARKEIEDGSTQSLFTADGENSNKPANDSPAISDKIPVAEALIATCTGAI